MSRLRDKLGLSRPTSHVQDEDSPQEDTLHKNLASLFVTSLTKAHPNLRPLLDTLLELNATNLVSQEVLIPILDFISDLTACARDEESAEGVESAMRQGRVILRDAIANGAQFTLREADAMIAKLKEICPLVMESAQQNSKVVNRRHVFLAALAWGSTTLGIIKDASEVSEVPFLKPLMTGLAGLVGALHTMELNRDGLNSLLELVGKNAMVITEKCSNPRVKSKNLDLIVRDLDRDLQRIVRTCKKLKKRPGILRLLENKNDENALASLNQALGEALAQFTTSVTLQMYGAVNDVDAKTDLILLGQHLPQHPDIPRRLYEYYQGSREGEVGEINAWLDDSQGSLVRWVYGPAGIGKSTLAHHLVEELRKKNQLAAEVFLSLFLGHNEDKTPTELVKVISREIGNTRLAARWKIAEAIRAEKGLSKDLPRLLEQCVLEPLRTACLEDVQIKSPVVVVVDGMDEWSPYLQFIAALEHLNEHSSTVRFILLGRTVPLSSSHAVCGTNISTQWLGGVPSAVIEEYLTPRLKNLPIPLGENGLGAQEAKSLAAKADGAFIWASVALSLISNEFSPKSPRQVFLDILSSKESIGGGETMLRILYRDGLELLFPDLKHRHLLQRYIQMLLALQECLPLADAARLLRIVRMGALQEIQTKLAAFHIRQQIDSTELSPAAILFHLSFIEYLQEENWGSSRNSHEMLGKTCLEQLAAPEFSCDSLSPYTIKYWPLHASRGSPPALPPAEGPVWKGSPMGIALYSVPLETLEEWAVLFLSAVAPYPDEYTVCTVTHERPHTQAKLFSALIHGWGCDSVGELMFEVGSQLTNSEEHLEAKYAVPCLEIAGRERPNDCSVWSTLGWSWCNQHTTVPEAIDEAIKAHKVAMDLREGDPQILYGLATAYQERYKLRRWPEDFPEPIKLHQKALSLMAPDDPRRHMVLHNLAVHKQRGDPNDLTEAIALFRETLVIAPPDKQHGALTNISIALGQRGAHRNATDDIMESVSFSRKRLELSPPGHSQHDNSLKALADGLDILYLYSNDVDHLVEAIVRYQELLKCFHPEHPDRGAVLHSLASAYQALFENQSDTDYLDLAIVIHRDALKLTPPGHPKRISCLEKLAMSYQSRFDGQGRIDDLTESIALYREILEYPSVSDNEHRAAALSHLANSLRSRFNYAGDICDLTAAIELHQEALGLRTLGHKQRDESLHYLASALQARYRCTGTTEDIHQAIDLLQEHLSLHEIGDSARGTPLCNLANALHTRYERLHDAADLEKAIDLRREHAEECDAEGDERAHALNGLANGLYTRFLAQGALEDVTEAISLYRQVLERQPAGHPNRHQTVTILSVSLGARFKLQSCTNIEDITDAISLNREILSGYQPGQANRGSPLNNVAWQLLLRWESQDGDLASPDFQEALSLAEEALTETIAPEEAARPKSAGDITIMDVMDTLARVLRHIPERLDEALMLAQTVTQEHRRWWFLQTLSTILLEKYRQLPNEIQYLSAAAVACAEALDLCPSVNYNYPALHKLEAEINDLSSKCDQHM